MKGGSLPNAVTVRLIRGKGPADTGKTLPVGPGGLSFCIFAHLSSEAANCEN